ncbi:MAG TPA: diguanylate cyclase [Pirellulaceae bacterium]|nr:diguanylate cyclase [Pirellulaceae bacterium]HMO93599.1 diguanylate cyclase [Pirellulaceae bacterium]HMP70523.1 diguanylate cyclase [Pirellulaceae bacterium]
MFLNRIRSTCRIALSLGFICAIVLWCAYGFKILPNTEQQLIGQRTDLCEAIAVPLVMMVAQNEQASIERLFENIHSRNEQIQSIGFRGQDGTLIVDVGNHSRKWTLRPGQVSNQDQMWLQIKDENVEAYRIEICFSPLKTVANTGFMFPLNLIVFCSAASGLLFWAYLTRVLKFLNPSKVVPNRVKNAFDSIAEGLMLINEREEIVLVNQAFSDMVAMSTEELQGRRPDMFDWQFDGDAIFPWTLCLQSKQARRADYLALQSNHQSRKFQVNTMPLEDTKGRCNGVLISLQDITLLEEKQKELNKMLDLLRTSRDAIQRQNKELTTLATTDPLTDCLNRRAYFEAFEIQWNSSSGEHLSVVMVDIDKFKSINDTHGHLTGDHVLKGVAAILRSIVGTQGYVCRFGGEEFSILTSRLSVEQVSELAENIRKTVSSEPIAGINVTCSLGISYRGFGAMDVQHLVDQADQALYVAKRTGRNRVCRWDTCTPDQLESELQQKSEVNHQLMSHYPTVTAMLTALSVRDRKSAEHSQRVAQLATALAEGLLPPSTIGDLECAALLHEVGKIGVSDSILFKPSELTHDEKQALRHHEKLSLHLIHSALANPQLVELISLRGVSNHRLCELVESGQISQQAILPAQILTVCDVFDSLTHDQPYRSAQAAAQTIEYLLESGDHRYNASVVARLINVLHADPHVYKLKNDVCLDSRAAVILSSEARELQIAIAENQREKVAEIIKQVEEQANTHRITPLIAAAQRLSNRLLDPHLESDVLIEDARHVIQICRALRATLTVTPQFDEAETT